jgi:division protein CdvB (Snf7/Vps24/ESCRT-III family)
MTNEEQEVLLRGIRERRMLAVGIYLQAQEEKKKVKDEKLSIKMDKLATRIANQVGKIDEQFEKLETIINQLRAVRLEADL